MDLSSLREEFLARFGRPAEVTARAPGRVNLIGEHTDYNEGFVLPVALEQSTWVACAPRCDQSVCAATLNLHDQRRWSLEGPPGPDLPLWTRYVAGVAALLRRRGARLGGFDLLIASDVPVGGGLSSSAALEVSAALALASLAGEPLASEELADLCRAAEHEFAGVPCGIMDQYICLLARAGCALLLDCRSRTWEHVPCRLDGHVFLLIDSGVRHELARGEYARRQEECRRGVMHFQRINPVVRALRDVSLESVRAQALQLDPVVAARCLHVAAENERTLAAARALRRGELAELGRLLSESHRSLRQDFEVSCPELDRIVERVGRVPGVLGARLTGGGFGGWVIALVRSDCLEAVRGALSADPPVAPPGAGVIVVRPARGASLEPA